MNEQPQRKAQIARAAEHLFSRRGYHATTVREIAAVLDMEGGSLYGHISGKYELLYKIVTSSSEQFRLAASQVLASGANPREQLRELMRRHVAIVTQDPDRAVVYHHEWRHLEPEHLELLKQQRNEYEQAFRQIIRAGIASGDFAPQDDRLAGIAILSLLNWTYTWYRPGGSLDAEGLANYFFNLIIGGLAPQPHNLSKEATG